MVGTFMKRHDFTEKRATGVGQKIPSHARGNYFSSHIIIFSWRTCNLILINFRRQALHTKLRDLLGGDSVEDVRKGLEKEHTGMSDVESDEVEEKEEGEDLQNLDWSRLHLMMMTNA